jgi:crossover junction endodeoxyribonuclease RuvC
MTAHNTVLLGIDPGYDRVGWAVGFTQGQRVTLVEYGCIQTTKSRTLFERYTEIDTALIEILTRLQPTELAIESLFFSKNKTTALTVSEARGVIISRCLQQHLAITEYAPVQIKQSVTGSGRADKTAVSKMVRLQSNLPPTEKLLDDTTDAIAILLTHAHSRTMSRAIARNNLVRSRSES